MHLKPVDFPPMNPRAGRDVGVLGVGRGEQSSSLIALRTRLWPCAAALGTSEDPDGDSVDSSEVCFDKRSEPFISAIGIAWSENVCVRASV